MRLRGKHVLVLAEAEFEDIELWYPLLRLKEEGARVSVVGNKEEYMGKKGMPVKVDAKPEDLDISKVDGVIVPGGWAPDRLRRQENILKLVKDLYNDKKLVATICHGGWVLISAGIVSGHQMTSFAAIKDDLKNGGADFVDEEVVVDYNIISSRTPADLPAFMREIIKFLEK